jgi:nucleotide sugar dehydrogenase
MKKIVIIGLGYVGRAMRNFFLNHYDVYVHDPFIDQSAFPDVKFINQSETNKCDLGIICVPTPRSDNGECDIRTVENVINWLETDLILLKSTVEVGTTDKFIDTYKKNIVFSPEFCGESTYWSPYLFDRDVKETPFFIFGGCFPDTSQMVDYFLPVTGPTKKYIQCAPKEAEMAKYLENSFYATKIAFCYEAFEICRAAKIDWNKVRELWLLDPRVNPMHTAVFAKNDKPFSGKCLPKDISALASLAKKVKYEPNLLDEVIKSNERICSIRKERREKHGSNNCESN